MNSVVVGVVVVVVIAMVIVLDPGAGRGAMDKQVNEHTNGAHPIRGLINYMLRSLHLPQRVRPRAIN